MGLININSILPEDVMNKLTEQMMEIEAKWNEPKPEDPSLVQIPGYSHSMDGSNHRIEKSPPYLTDEEKKFTPIVFTENDRKERFGWFRNQVFEGVTKYLLSQYPEDFNRITELEVLEVNETSSGSVQDMVAQGQMNYMFLRKLWDADDFHLFVSWKAKYKFLKDRSKRTDVKMSDLTLGPEGYTNGVARVEDIKEESKGYRTEEGEIVVSFSSSEYGKLTQYAAVDYIAILDLAGKKLKAEIDGSYITQTGVILWKNKPTLQVEDYTPPMSTKALEKSLAITQNTQDNWKKTSENIKQEYLKTVKSTSGIYAQKKEEVKFMFEDFKAECKELSDVSGEFAARMAKLASVPVVTTPTGPGLAVNAIVTELDNLKATASSMTGIISKIENLMNKLQLHVYAPLIPGLNGVYMAIKNLLSLAKTAISLIP